VTTSIAFGGLLLAPFASLRQVAVFAIFGLSGAYLTVFCVLPRLLSADRMVAAPAALRLAARGLAGRQRRRRWAVIGLMVLVGAAVPGLMQLQSRDDLRAMYFSPPDLMAQASRVRAIVGGFDVSQMLIVRGEDQEDVLTALERLTPGLVTLQAQGDLETYLHAARALPSMRRQQEAHRLLAETVYAPGAALDQLASGLNAPASWAEARRVAFHASTPLRYETWREDMASTPYPGLIEHLPDGWVGLVRVGGVRDASAVRAWVDTQRQAGVDVVWRDTVASAQQRLGAGREMAARVLLLAAVVVLIVLAVRYGIRGGATVALPSALAVIGTLGLCGWLGSPFTVFRLFALLLVIGLSIDYAVFAREAGEHSTATLLAILLSALTTLLSFGLLALSATPALAEFGATVVVGIVLGLGSTLLLWRVRLSGAAP
ncbi:hypothetical protein, partial [uncultured Abyssibacter sp.]|uniref:hypothetical protein n=1 Tax=uncultured Abyssibacter sp. TaxID=2320202 RepID=UPI0032B1851B